MNFRDTAFYEKFAKTLEIRTLWFWHEPIWKNLSLYFSQVLAKIVENIITYTMLDDNWFYASVLPKIWAPLPHPKLWKSNWVWHLNLGIDLLLSSLKTEDLEVLKKNINFFWHFTKFFKIHWMKWTLKHFWNYSYLLINREDFKFMLSGRVEKIFYCIKIHVEGGKFLTVK